jgi:hypothetical protein
MVELDFHSLAQGQFQLLCFVPASPLVNISFRDYSAAGRLASPVAIKERAREFSVNYFVQKCVYKNNFDITLICGSNRIYRYQYEAYC